MLGIFIKEVMGVREGTIKSLPDSLALELIDKGILEPIRITPKTEEGKDTAKVFKTAKKGGKQSKRK